jgi:hypothetical protein
VSTSPIFYEKLFTVVFCTAFMLDFGIKAAHKMLVKLTPNLVFSKSCLFVMSSSSEKNVHYSQ